MFHTLLVAPGAHLTFESYLKLYLCTLNLQPISMFCALIVT